MAHEEHSQKCSNSSSGGGGGGGSSGGAGGGIRSSKKMKQKKVPQRGLGVAQLEKIRIEEQQKKDSMAIYSPNSIISPSNSSCLAVQCPNFRQNPSSPSSIPLPPLSPSDLSSSVFRPAAHLIPNKDVLNLNSVSDLQPLNEIGLPKFWNCENNQNLEGDKHRLLDHQNHGFATRSNNLNLPCEFRTLPNVMNRPEQFHQPPSSSMVNVSSGTSSSSVINYQMEPPSNQSYYGNNYTAMWPEEDKMVGMKRSYPFSLDNPPVPSFHCKFPPTYVAPITRSDESASYSNGGTVNIEHGDLIFREGPSTSSAMAEPNSKKVTKENRELNGDFLTLAPPTTTIPQMGSNYKHPSAYVTPHCHELPKFESLPYQGSVEEQVHWQRPSESTQQQLLYSFFAPAKTQTGQEATTISKFNGEVGESVDLNLKL